MSTDKPQWSGILERVVAQSDSGDTAAMIRAALGNWEKLSAILIPLLGKFSFYLIYRRSLDLSKSVFPWLPMATGSSQVHEAFADLGRALEGQGSGELTQVNLALLHPFAELLAALIGERLTSVYLRAAFRNNLVPDTTGEDRP